MANAASLAAPYGTWSSPISSALASQGAVTLSEMKVDSTMADVIYWSEMHPGEEGRVIIFSSSAPYDTIERWTPKGYSVNTRVHEYGGGAFMVHDGTVYFVNGADQCIYKQASVGGTPVAVTTDGNKCRYADLQFCSLRFSLVCIREDHSNIGKEDITEAVNTIVSISLQNGSETILVSGADFYSNPRLLATGQHLLWAEWDHPNMPWDETRVRSAQFSKDDGGQPVTNIQEISMQPGVNYSQPRWTSDGRVLCLNDATNWLNLYLHSNSNAVNLLPISSDLGAPEWRLGRNCYSKNPQIDSEIAVVHDKVMHILDTKTGLSRHVNIPGCFASFLEHSPDGKLVYIFCMSPVSPSSIKMVACDTLEVTTIRTVPFPVIEQGVLTQPESICFPTDGGDSVAYGYFYPPKNLKYKCPDDELPPLLVKAHGGPTSCASLTLDTNKQYFTSRGFAVLDVDYRGSTGYGSTYRKALNRKWGVHDIEDCCSGALYLANVRKQVDVTRLVIDGGSAGGYTTLGCLTFRDIFKAGASHYGISYLSALARETHKFESRYIETLIGEYPKEKERFDQLSPISHIDQLNVATAFFQGGLDKIVPPNQARVMYEAVLKRGLPCAYVLFPDEYHGFSKSVNKRKALDGEFYFFSRVLGFDPADDNIAIPVDNMDHATTVLK